MELFKLVVVFDKDLTEDEFTKREHSLLKYINSIHGKMHEVKGFGNTKVRQGDKTIYGWCDYIFFTAEKENTDQVYRELQRNSLITKFQITILKGEAKSKIDTSKMLDVNNLRKTKIVDAFNLIFNC